MAGYADLLMRVLQDVEDGRKPNPSDKEQLRQYAQSIGDAALLLKTWDQGDKRIQDAFINFPFYPFFSEVLVEDRTSITIQIPSGYKHILAISNGRVSGTDAGNPYRAILARFNGDAGASNYQWQEVSATATSAAGVHDLTFDAVVIAFFQNQSADANSATGGFTFIPHYRSSFWKQVYSISGAQNYNGTNASVGIVNAYWKNTSPIDTMTIFGDISTDLKAGSIFSFYGIK